MRFRKLRIAWSVGWGVAAVLLIVLWVRSFVFLDSALHPSLQIHSFEGRIVLLWNPPKWLRQTSQNWWQKAKKSAIFVPGKGYTISGMPGYYAGDGNPMAPTVNPPWGSDGIRLNSERPTRTSRQYLSSVQGIENRWGFGAANDWNTYVYVIPHWFSILAVTVLATVPWLRRRFSLRTLLIATTLIAVVLGLAVSSTS
jgi:hypothetical protein